MLKAQRRVEKLERRRQSDNSSPIVPCVYLIESDGYTRTYRITLNGRPVDEHTKPRRGGVLIIVDGAPGEEIK